MFFGINKSGITIVSAEGARVYRCLCVAFAGVVMFSIITRPAIIGGPTLRVWTFNLFDRPYWKKESY